MTSCPSEEDLVLFVEDEVSVSGEQSERRDRARAASDEIAEHLTECAGCRRLVARSEAALRYALGGVADRDHAPALALTAAAARRRPWRWTLVPAAAALLAAAAVGASFLAPRDEHRGDAARTSAHATGATASVADRVDELLARAERLRDARPAPESDVALAALAAADARLALGMTTAAARFEDVVERFPGTPEAREARARLAEIGARR